MEYPKVIFETTFVEIIACSKNKYRLLYKGNFVANFKTDFAAYCYQLKEF